MYSKKQDFFETPQGEEIKAVLQSMSGSDDYVTLGSYSPHTNIFATNSMSFVEKHMTYIRKHPNLNPEQYVSNLKIMSRKNR